MYIGRTKQIYRLIPHVNIRWICYDLFMNGLKQHKLGEGMLVIDVFDKFMHVVPVKGKKEEDLASGIQMPGRLPLHRSPTRAGLPFALPCYRPAGSGAPLWARARNERHVATANCYRYGLKGPPLQSRTLVQPVSSTMTSPA